MNPEIKALWLGALRSGEYVQGKAALHQIVDGVEKFCCLGVLCKLAAEAEVIPAPELVRSDCTGHDEYLYGLRDRSVVYLPGEVREWADLPDSGIGFGGNEGAFEGDEGKSLARRNDDGTSFEDLAHIIEEYL